MEDAASNINEVGFGGVSIKDKLKLEKLFSIKDSWIEDNVEGYEELVDAIMTSCSIANSIHKGAWFIKQEELKEKNRFILKFISDYIGLEECLSSYDGVIWTVGL